MTVLVLLPLLAGALTGGRAAVPQDAGRTSSDRLQAEPETPEVERLLDRLIAAPDSSRAPVVRRLQELGEPGLAALVRRLAALEPDSEARRALLEALLALPAGTTRSWFAESAASSSSVAVRRVGIEVLTENGTAADLLTVLRLASIDEQADDPSALGPELQVALIRILERDEHGFGGLWALAMESPPGLHRFVAAGIEGAGSAEGLPGLVRLLDVTDEQPAVLTAIAGVARAADAPFPEAVRSRVRPWIYHPRADVRGAAAHALGALEDAESVPRLIEILRSDHAGGRQQAHAALRCISGHSFRSNPERWESWFQSESLWWQERSETVFAALSASEASEVISAIRKLVCHRLYRHELAAELLPLLDHPDEYVAALAALALGQLGSPIAIPHLTSCRERGGDALRRSAESALESIDRRPVPH